MKRIKLEKSKGEQVTKAKKILKNKRKENRGGEEECQKLQIKN